MRTEPDRRGPQLLSVTAPVDAWGSFALPLLLLAAVPVLAVADASRTLVGVVGLVVIGCAVVLGGCGIVMAVAMARTMRRGGVEHPELARFLARTSSEPDPAPGRGPRPGRAAAAAHMTAG